MARMDVLPFTVGQEVEAKFSDKGYRGAWFRCRILEIAAAEPRLLVQYLDFPDEDPSRARVRMADPTVKNIEPWLKQKKPSIWMVRPVIPFVHESDVEKYQEDIRTGQKSSGYVFIYNDMYMVGDMVDWLKDDCYWGVQIVEINTETNAAKIKEPLPPVGEGDGNTQRAPLKELRPSFSWNPKHQWRQLGLKKKEAGTGVEKCKSDKPHIQRVYLSGDSMTPAVVSDDRCGPISSGNMGSVCKSEPDDLAVNSRGTPREERHNNSDSHELVVTSENVYDRVKLRRKSTVDGAKSLIKQESPHEVKLEKRRRKVRFSSSFAMSESDEEEQSSPTGEPENIDGVLEHLRNGTAVGDSMNDSVVTADEGLPQGEFVIHDTVLENGVSATCSTPSNADDRKGGTVVPEHVGDKINLPVESLGSCLTTENADGLGDQTAEVDGDGTSDVRPQTHLVVPRNVLENSPSPNSIAGCADDLSVARVEVYSPAHDGGTAPREEITDSVTIVYTRRRRREKDQLKISRKRLCQFDTYQRKPLSSSVPPTSANNEKKVSVLGSIVKPEPGTYEEENTMHVIDDSIPEPLWVLPALRRSLDTRKSQNLRQPESANQVLLLGSGNVSSKVNAGLKRKQVDNMDPGKDSKKMRADVSTALVEAVGNSPTPAGVDLPRMRGSIKFSKRKPLRLRQSKTSHKPSSQGKYLDATMDRKEKLVEYVGFQQDQQLKDPFCGHIEQKSVEKSSLSGLPTKCHLSSGSNHGISSLGKLGSKALEKESKRKNWHQSRGNSDSEVLDNESEENKSKLQPNGDWCIKDGNLVYTEDQKVEKLPIHSIKEESLSLCDLVKTKEKGRPPSHTSSSCLREQADGNHLFPESSVLNERLLKCSTLAKSTKRNASESSSTTVEANVGSTVFIAKDVNEMAVGVSSLNKTSGADEQEGEGQDAGVPEIIHKVVKSREQELSVISTKKDASVGLGVETSSLFTTGDIQGGINTVRGGTACSPTEGPLDSSRREKVVNADKDIRSGGIVQDEPVVKVEVLEPELVAAAGSAHDSWIHDTVKCCYGRDALDRVSMNNFETTEEIEVARQVKMALWRGLCCSSQSCGLGLDLFKRIQLLLQPRMHFQTLTDGDSRKILLSTGKPGEEIYLGRFKTEMEFGAARRIISRCKKVLQKSMIFFEAPHNPQVTSDVLQTKVLHAGTSQVISVKKESSSSLVEATEQRTRPTSAIQPIGEPSMQSLTISREFGQSSTRTEISPKPSIAAGDSTPVPTSKQVPCRQTLVSSGAAARPPGSSQNVIVLDDDDDNEVHVIP